MNKGVQFEAGGQEAVPDQPGRVWRSSTAGAFEGLRAVAGERSAGAHGARRQQQADDQRPAGGRRPRQRGAHRGRRRGRRHPQLQPRRGGDQRQRHARLRDEPGVARRLGDRHLGQRPVDVQEIARIASAALPSDAFALQVLRGKELFNTSIGPEGTNDNARKPAGRMSDSGWGSCYGCHPRGLTDGVTWMFGDGPRQTVSMESTAAHPQTRRCSASTSTPTSRRCCRHSTSAR